MGCRIFQMTRKAQVSIIQKQTIKEKQIVKKLIKYKITLLNAIIQMIKEQQNKKDIYW